MSNPPPLCQLLLEISRRTLSLPAVRRIQQHDRAREGTMSSVEKEDELVAPVDSADVTRQLTQDLFREASLPAWRFAVLSVGYASPLLPAVLRR
jgi:hypothetical protein